jgi:bacteriocin-like protein
VLISLKQTRGIIMKLIGNLKKQVDETTSKEEAKKVIEKAGIELTDDELDQVTGGTSIPRSVWVPVEF